MVGSIARAALFVKMALMACWRSIGPMSFMALARSSTVLRIPTKWRLPFLIGVMRSAHDFLPPDALLARAFSAFSAFLVDGERNASKTMDKPRPALEPR